MKNAFESFKNHFLISMPQLSDTEFEHTVIYLCEHTRQGAMGITINKPSSVDFDQLAQHLELEIADTSLLDRPVYSGGPMESERGFILHSAEKQWSNTLPVTDEISLSAALETIEDIASGKGPNSFIITLGCVGWDKDQLEEEIANNHWLVCEADLDVLFNTPSEMQFSAATQVLGFDMSRLSPDVGHG